MDRLFEEEPANPADRDRNAHGTPLSTRLRPTTLDEFVGQRHILGEDSALREALVTGEPPSMILHGPPGSGKTTLARIAAHYASAAFEELSAVNAGKAEVRAVIERARERRKGDQETIFFLDEIHRFNKAQQDQLLPAVEEGVVTLIGATTENPYFEVNSALISRTRVFQLEPLKNEDVVELLQRALAQGECGDWQVGEDVLAFLAERSDGDARSALNALELACATARRRANKGETDGEPHQLTIADAEDALQRRAVLYDKGGDQHYDYISAWIKSTRGSDPDASLYYLAIMLEGGEDARFIARRMVILASEDIGNADPSALSLAVAAAQAVEHVGLPECQYALAQAAIYLSLAPKSDAAKQSISEARRHIRNTGAKRAPSELQGNPFPGARGPNKKPYDSPHSHPDHINTQQHLPEGLDDLRFYIPDEVESELGRRLDAIRTKRRVG